jgi:hypothetical protein
MNRNSSYSMCSLPLYCVAFFTAAALLLSCHESPKQKETTRNDSVVLGASDTTKVSVASDNADDENAIFYLVIADTGKSYSLLDAKMYELSRVLKWPVDTMNRHYDLDKGQIVLADDDEDDMYRGEYFPRRSPSTTLSLEYYTVYGKATPDNIALVAGIFEQKTSADSMKKILKPYAMNAFVLRSEVYTGCMH